MSSRLPLGANLVLLVLVSSVLMVSGCINTGTDTVSYGNGVVIKAFEPDFSSVESGDSVTLRLMVQNQGEVDATNVKAVLYGIDLDEWGTYTLNTEKDIGTLRRADKTTNTDGQESQVQWSLEAPQYPEGIKFTHTPYVRVTYDYKTRAIKPITLVDVDELRRIRDAGGSIPGGATQSSAGPLSVDIKTGDFVKTEDFNNIFPLNIRITNNGGGGVIESGYTGWNYEDFKSPVKMTITLPSGMSLRSSEGCSTSQTVNLWKGKDTMVTCEVSIDNPPDIRTQKTIQIDLEYTYYIDASTNIEVSGTKTDWY